MNNVIGDFIQSPSRIKPLKHPPPPIWKQPKDAKGITENWPRWNGHDRSQWMIAARPSLPRSGLTKKRMRREWPWISLTAIRYINLPRFGSISPHKFLFHRVKSKIAINYVIYGLISHSHTQTLGDVFPIFKKELGHHGKKMSLSSFTSQPQFVLGAQECVVIKNSFWNVPSPNCKYKLERWGRIVWSNFV